MPPVHPADTALLVALALRRASATLAVLVVLLAGGAAAAAAGLVAVLVLHLVVAARARRHLAARLDREWAAVEPVWRRPRAT